MSSPNKDNNIPIWLIIMCYCIAPPLGIILTILKAIPYLTKTSIDKSASQFSSQMRNNMNYSSSQQQYTKENVNPYSNHQRFTQNPQANQTANQSTNFNTQRRTETQYTPRNTQTAAPKTSTTKTQTKSKKKGMSGLRKAALAVGGIFTLASFGNLMGLFEYFTFADLATLMVMTSIAAGSFIVSHQLGIHDSRRARIIAMIGNQDSINLAKLAAASKCSLKTIQKDVQALIDKGEFGNEAYIDLYTNNFMRYATANPDVLEGFDYKSVYDKKIFGSETEKKVADAKAVDDSLDNIESDDYKSIIREIRRLNDSIADRDVSEKIFRIEDITKDIFAYVTEHPEAKPQIRTFMNYYLPTTLKMLQAYAKLEEFGVAGDNMKQSKEKIEGILDTLVTAFSQTMDQLYSNDVLDIASEISVLETMIQKDGLSGKSDFDLGYTDGYTDDISSDLSSGGAAAAPTDEDDGSINLHL